MENKMKNKFKRVLLVCTVFAAFGACRPTVDLTPVDASDGLKDGFTYVTTSDSYADIFKAFWQGMNANYVYWDVEPTGYWDDMWNKYKPLFDELGTYDNTNAVAVTSAKTYISEMVAQLKDGHFSIDFEDGTACHPPKDRVEGRYNPAVTPDADPNADPKTVFHHWVTIPQADLKRGFDQNGGSDWRWASVEVSSDDTLQMATGAIALSAGGGHIRYLYFSEFAISPYISTDVSPSSKRNSAVVALMNAFWTDLGTAECKGVIFDMRGNGGGSNVDIPLLLSPLLASDLTFAHERIKKSAARLDYAAWTPYVIKANPDNETFTIDVPSEGAISYHPSRAANAGTMPVVCLINDYSISCGELMPMAIKEMPGGHLIGTKTWGGTGPRQGDTSPNETHGGCFTHNKLWTKVTQAGWQTRGLNFENYEGIGVSPDDDPVEFDLTRFNAGDDAQLVKAVAYVNNHL
jgi:hypothetical protein